MYIYIFPIIDLDLLWPSVIWSSSYFFMFIAQSVLFPLIKSCYVIVIFVLCYCLFFHLQSLAILVLEEHFFVSSFFYVLSLCSLSSCDFYFY